MSYSVRVYMCICACETASVSVAGMQVYSMYMYVPLVLCVYVGDGYQFILDRISGSLSSSI